MTSGTFRKWTLVNGLLLLLLLVPAGLAQEQTPQAPVEKRTSEKNAQPQSNASVETHGAHDGVKVHGHWTIVIRNADGSISSRHEFENGLVGDTVLAGILARTTTVGPWSVAIRKPCTVSGFPGVCVIQEANPPLQSVSQPFPNLTVQQGGTAPQLNTVVLSGSAKSAQGGTITEVETNLTTCAPTTAPSACGATASTIHKFTSQTISQITVQPGQSIDVTVQLSFS